LTKAELALTLVYAGQRRAIMLSRRDNLAWSLADHDKREYRSEEERKFFETIKNPPEPTKELKEIAREFGRFAVQTPKKD
jgi:hypothetical protein